MRAIRRKTLSAVKLSPGERRTVEHLLSMENALSFGSEIEIVYCNGKLTAGVLSRLFSNVNKASMNMNRKRAMLRAITDYNSKV